MPSNRGKAKTVIVHGKEFDVVELTWQTTDPMGLWSVWVDSTTPALLKELVMRMQHPQNPGFTLDLWTYQAIDRLSWSQMKHGKIPVPPR